MATETMALEHMEARSLQSQEMTVDDLVRQVRKIQEVMEQVMRVDEHFGTIPGTKKPCLYKAGAEKLNLLFRMAPRFIGERSPLELGNGHREYVITCELIHIPTGNLLGAGVGSCSTMESKYRWRNAERQCPECGEAKIIKGKAEFGGGFLCWKKNGGCGAKFAEDDDRITSQQTRAENPDIADCYNTVLKMAKKRAHVDAVLTATAASDIFTQDLEDLPRPPDIYAITPGNAKAETPQHASGGEHKAANCKECLAAGVPKDCTAVLNNRHIYIRRGEKSPQHDFEHKSYIYCPQCKADKEKESQVPVQSPQMPTVPAPAGAGEPPVQNSPAPESLAASQKPSETHSEERGAPPLQEEGNGAPIASLFVSGDPEIIKKVARTYEKHEKPIAKKDKDALIHRAVELGWSDAEFNKLLAKFNCKNLAEITVGVLDELRSIVETGGGGF